MKCNSCSRDIVYNANYCPYCGIRTPQKEQSTKKASYILSGEVLRYFYNDVNLYVEKDAPRLCTLDERLKIRQEKDNEHDENAVAIWTSNNKKLGYLYKGKLQDMVNDFLNRGETVEACVSYVNIDEGKVTVSLAFYKEINQDDYVKTFKVSVSEKKYEESGCVFEGYEVDADYDYERDCYVLDDWGKLPKRLNEYAESGKYSFVVIDIEEKENGGYSVEIGILERGDV